MPNDLNLDLTPTETGRMDYDATKVIYQLQEWHASRVDQLNTVVQSPKSTSIQIGDIELTTARETGAFKAGVSLALTLLGTLPIHVKEPED
ncbi:hypothetical protein PRUB_a4063 [Pseudoalteromonas rubra]|uniref:Uncharacterized protein n=1 Tax=Pseudoalteromonas rubra TaxID=43658 RepID=A0A8T0CB20_9GAMM|nr:hypothetical protein [Pseudoalteromonas rubra]KAF7787185.1 hypothetical protein PRUB_a4063 [Pseudoalteromonas rubra]